MKGRVDVSTMVRSMGLGMNVLTKLMEAIEVEGGSPDVLALLTRERFNDNLNQIARAIIQCDWRIPASEMRDRAEKWYRENFVVREEPEVIEEVRNFWWYAPMGDLGLPYQRFDNSDNGDDPRIPDLLRSKLDGVIIEYPLFVDEKREKVVVDIGLELGWAVKGVRIDGENLANLAIADARYFDFDR